MFLPAPTSHVPLTLSSKTSVVFSQPFSSLSPNSHPRRTQVPFVAAPSPQVASAVSGEHRHPHPRGAASAVARPPEGAPAWTSMHGCCLLELSHNRWCRHNNSSHKCASVVLRDDVYATRPMLQKGSHNTTSVTKVRKTLGREIMSDSKAQNLMDLLKRSAGRRVARPKEFARD